MKNRVVLAIILFAVLISTLPSLPAVALERPNITAGNAILIDLDNDRVIYGRGEDDTTIHPNIATKTIMALVVMDLEPNLERVITIPPGEYMGNDFGIYSGGRARVKDLIIAMLIRSSTEAGNALADFYTSGNRNEFLDLMNEKVESIGAEDTVFTSFQGNQPSASSTSMIDIAKMSLYAIENPTFREFSNMTFHVNYNETVIFSDNQSLLFESAGFIQGAVTITNHFTHFSGASLGTILEQDGRRFFAAVYGSADVIAAPADTRMLFEFGRAAYQSVTIVQEGQPITEVRVAMGQRGSQRVDAVVAEATEDLAALLPVNFDQSLLIRRLEVPLRVDAPVERGQILGQLVYEYDGEEVGRIYLASTTAVELNMMSYHLARLNNFFTNPVVLAISVLLLLLLVTYIIIVIRYNVKRRRAQRFKATRLRPKYEDKKR